MELLTSVYDFSREAALALRFLARRPRFAAAALVTLALGMGAPAAIYSVVHAVLMRPLPYPEPDRLVQFRIEGRGPAGPVSFEALPAATALEWGAQSSALSALALFNDRALTLSSADGPFRLTGIAGTPNLFAVLGVAPELGQTFDAASSETRLIVLSHDTWQRFFAGDSSAVGTTATLDGDRYLVIGVMPKAFGFPTPDAAFWVPLPLGPGDGRGMLLPAVARLAPDATVPAVADEGRRLLEGAGLMRGGGTLLVRTMQDQMVGGVRRMLSVLMAAVSFVFVIATTNIGLLLLTRGAGREHEFGVRLALGARRARLVRQLFIESLVLAALGSVAGLALAAVSLDALLRLAPPDMPRLREATLDGSVLGFTCILTVVTSVVFGLLSAGRAVVTDLARAGGRLAGAPGRTSRRRLNLLAASELALTMVLLVGAGLLLRSFLRAVLVNQGFQPRGALAMEINLPAARYPSAAARLAFHQRLLERLQHGAVFEAAGLTTAMPNRQPSARIIVSAEGLPPVPDPFTTPNAEVRTVSEGFIEAMGIALRAGRTFRPQDGPGAEPVIVISERLARQHFPDRSPVGQLLYSRSATRRIVGVVGDVRPAAPGTDLVPAAYLPMRQDEGAFRWFATVTMVVRGKDLTAAAGSLRTLVLSLDPEMPPFNVRTLSAEVSKMVAAQRFSAALLAVFAGVALILAAVGVYGVLAYSTGLRTREIGVRIALGATRAQILRLVLRDGMLILSSGLTGGLIAAMWLAQALTGLLHEVTPADPVALAAVTTVLLSAGLLAAYLPARRATRISAIDALRHD
jgi:predicted permease